MHPLYVTFIPPLPTSPLNLSAPPLQMPFLAISPARLQVVSTDNRALPKWPAPTLSPDIGHLASIRAAHAAITQHMPLAIYPLQAAKSNSSSEEETSWWEVDEDTKANLELIPCGNFLMYFLHATAHLFHWSF